MTVDNVTAFPQQNQSLSGGNSLVSVLLIRPSPKPGGATLAYADVRIGPVTIKGFSILRNKAGGESVLFPARSVNGHWYPVVEVDEPVRSEVIKLVLECYRKLNG